RRLTWSSLLGSSAAIFAGSLGETPAAGSPRHVGRSFFSAGLARAKTATYFPQTWLTHAPTCVAHLDVTHEEQVVDPGAHSVAHWVDAHWNTGKPRSTAPSQAAATQCSQQGPTWAPVDVRTGASLAGHAFTQLSVSKHAFDPKPDTEYGLQFSKAG